MWVQSLGVVNPWRRKWEPTPGQCLENPMDRRDCQGTIHGRHKRNQTRLTTEHTHILCPLYYSFYYLYHFFPSLLAITQHLKMSYFCQRLYICLDTYTPAVYTQHMFTHVSLCKHSLLLMSLNSSKSSFSRHSLSLFPDDPWPP